MSMRIVKKNLPFEHALSALRNGALVAREGWNGKGMFLRLQQPADPEQGRLPAYPRRRFIEMKDATDMVVPWLASQTDLLEDDWCVVEYA